MNKNIISLENIAVSFDGEKILNDINLDIKDKEFVTFLGPSGCGNTDRDSLSGETHLPGPTVAVEKSRGFVRIRFPAAGGRRLRQPGRTFIGRSFSGPVFLHRISLPGWLRQSGRPGTV